MVIGTSSMPTIIPHLGCREEGNFIHCKQISCVRVWLWNSSIVLQLNYEAPQLWNNRVVRQPCRRPRLATQLCSAVVHRALLCSAPARCLQCFSSTQGSIVLSLWRKGEACFQSQSGLTYTWRSPGAYSLIGPSSCNENSKSSQFDWSKKHRPDWSEWSLTDWSANMPMKI